MQGFIKGAFNTFLSITGVNRFIALWGNEWNWQRIMCIALFLALFLFIFGTIRLLPKVAASMGKTFGGVAIGLIKLAIGIGLAMGIANMLIGMGMGMIAGALGKIPLIGNFLANVANWLIGAIASILVAIMMGLYLIKNVGSLLGQAMGVVTGAVGDWKDEKDGICGVKTSYVVAVLLVIGGMICHPVWNAEVYFAPAIGAGVFGIVAIVKTTFFGRSVAESIVGAVVSKPRESDGAWKCPNHSPTKPKPQNPLPLLGKDMKPLRGENGKIKGEYVKHCPGPIGINPDTGKPYGGWNPKEARDCLSLLCDHPNPYWQVCTKCGFAGTDKKGYRRAPPNQPDRCPKCRNVHPPIPEWTKFHLPGQDKSNPATGKAKAPPKASKATPSSASAPVVSARPAPAAGSKFCSDCGAAYDPTKGYKVCLQCGQPLAAPGPVPVAPAAVPLAVGAPPPASTAAAGSGAVVVPITAARKGHRDLKSKWRRTF